MIDFLLGRGFVVFAVDMPLEGRNAPGDVGPQTHSALVSLDDGIRSPIGRLVLPAKLVLDQIEAEATASGAEVPTVVMMGRSGGGWTTNLVGALDDRVDLAVSIAGGLPQSQHLLDMMGPWEVGDYEQYVPQLYDVIGNENFIASAGSRGLFVAYSPVDLCCHRLGPDAPFVEWLRRFTPTLGKQLSISIDPSNLRHGLSPTQFDALGRFLDETTN